jgi:two-component system chemotaxis sensor kinase CheA
VDVTVLDRLMNLVGELVLARNQVLQFTATQSDPGFLATSQRINALTTELQEGVMKTRMQPIDNVWSKFPRVVRDVAGALKKQVSLQMEGRETELDKTIIEAIRDPLTHLIRNAIDHGIETPEKRLKAGKPATGTLHLRAYHEGGQVNIEIIDDGNGIPPEVIKRKALEKGLVSPERIARMSDRDIVNLIFLPGFSTAEKVTNVSGRGVGMDVVKTNIEKIGGTVDVQSRPGQGSTFKLKIPLTLAIVPALMVEAGRERFAIPQVSLLELVRLEKEDAEKTVEFVQGVPVYRLRGDLLPLVYLSKELALDSQGSEDGALSIVVLQADGTPFGLVVEDIRDTEEIVVKPLGKLLNGLASFAGATIMGDGRVALILDVLGLAQRAGIVASMRDQLVDAGRKGAAAEEQEKQTVLVFKVGESDRMAIPLAEVARLEELPTSAIELLSGRSFVQYRGGVMPLVRVSRLVAPDEPPIVDGDKLHIVVHQRGGLNVGLVVDGILDIVEEALHVQTEMARNGVAGCAVVQGRVTEVLSLPDLVAAAAVRSAATVVVATNAHASAA